MKFFKQRIITYMRVYHKYFLCTWRIHTPVRVHFKDICQRRIFTTVWVNLKIFYSAEEYTPLCELILMNLFKWTIIISVRLHCKDFYSSEEYTPLWESTLRIFFNWRIFTCVWVNFRRIYTPVRVHFNVIFLMKNIHPCASPF